MMSGSSGTLEADIRQLETHAATGHKRGQAVQQD
jgi:hypothetical protein